MALERPQCNNSVFPAIIGVVFLSTMLTLLGSVVVVNFSDVGRPEDRNQYQCEKCEIRQQPNGTKQKKRSQTIVFSSSAEKIPHENRNKYERGNFIVVRDQQYK
jgi:hypothetical protein